jgi:hypothetical protein
MHIFFCKDDLELIIFHDTYYTVWISIASAQINYDHVIWLMEYAINTKRWFYYY